MDSQGSGGLGAFAMQLEDYSPTVPECVVAHYLSVAGFESHDPRLVRLIAIAAQKFLADVANDALQHCKTRSHASSSTSSSSSSSKHHHSSAAGKDAKNKEKRYVMTMEDLAPALHEYGIEARKPHYYI